MTEKRCCRFRQIRDKGMSSLVLASRQTDSSTFASWSWSRPDRKGLGSAPEQEEEGWKELGGAHNEIRGQRCRWAASNSLEYMLLRV